MDLTTIEARILRYIDRNTTAIENNVFYEAIGMSAHEAKRALDNLLDRMLVCTNGVYSLSDAGREWVKANTKSDDSKRLNKSVESTINVNVGTIDNLCTEVGKLNAHIEDLKRGQENDRRTMNNYQDSTARTLALVTLCKEQIDSARRDYDALSARVHPLEKETWGGGKKPGLVHWRDTSWRKIGRFLLMLAWLFILPICVSLVIIFIQIYIVNLQIQALELEIQTLQSTTQCDTIDTLTIWSDPLGAITRATELPPTIISFDERNK